MPSSKTAPLRNWQGVALLALVCLPCLCSGFAAIGQDKPGPAALAQAPELPPGASWVSLVPTVATAGLPSRFAALGTWSGSKSISLSIAGSDAPSFSSTLTGSWEDSSAASGCFVTCLEAPSSTSTLFNGELKYCSDALPALIIGSIAQGVPCIPGALAVGPEGEVFVSGSFQGTMSYFVGAEKVSLSSAADGSYTAFVATIYQSVTGTSMVKVADVLDPGGGSHISSLSASETGAWLVGSTQEPSSFSNSQGSWPKFRPGTFLAHLVLDRADPSVQSLDLSWATSLGGTHTEDLKLTAITGADSSCAAFAAGSWTEGTALIYGLWAMQAPSPLSLLTVSLPPGCQGSSQLGVGGIFTNSTNSTLTVTAVAARGKGPVPDALAYVATYDAESDEASIYRVPLTLSEAFTWTISDAQELQDALGHTLNASEVHAMVMDTEQSLYSLSRTSAEGCVLSKSTLLFGASLTGFGCSCTSATLDVPYLPSSSLPQDVILSSTGTLNTTSAGCDWGVDREYFGSVHASELVFAAKSLDFPAATVDTADLIAEQLQARLLFQNELDSQIDLLLLFAKSSTSKADILETTIGILTLVSAGGDFFTMDRLLEIASELQGLLDEDTWDIQTGSGILAVLSRIFEIGLAYEPEAAEVVLAAVDSLGAFMFTQIPEGDTAQLAAPVLGIVAGRSTTQKPLRGLMWEVQAIKLLGTDSFEEISFPNELKSTMDFDASLIISAIPLHKATGEVFLSWTTRARLFSPGTTDEIPVKDLFEPIFIGQIKRVPISGANLPRCSFYNDTEKQWSIDGCASMPSYHPKLVEIRYNRQWSLFPNGSQPLDAPWFMYQKNTSEYDENFDCEFLANPLIPSDDYQTYLVKYDLVGDNCPYTQAWQKTNPYVAAMDCIWDTFTQEFYGFGCATSPEQICACRHLTDFRLQSMPVPTTATTSRVVEYDPVYPEFTQWIYPASVLGAGVVMYFLTRMIKHWQRVRLVGQMMEPEYGFHLIDQSGNPVSQSQAKDSERRKWAKSARADELIWVWQFETHLNEVLADELAGGEHVGLFATTQGMLFSLMGLPAGRFLCTLPNIDNLSHWHPANKVAVPVEQWRNQAMGTSAVMAFLKTRRVISSKNYEAMLKKQEVYFAGCHQLGFRVLIRRWKSMLHRNLHKSGWYERTCVWRLVWLQRSDGLWDFNNDFYKAVGMEPDVLVPYIGATALADWKTLKDELPPFMPLLFQGFAKSHIYDVWATVLAQAFLEQSTESWRIFTGRETGNRKNGTLIAAIAKDCAIQYANKCQNLVIVAERMRSSTDSRPDVEVVVGRLVELARQAIKSVHNLRSARLHSLAKSKLSKDIRTAAESKKGKKGGGGWKELTKEDKYKLSQTMARLRFEQMIALLKGTSTKTGFMKTIDQTWTVVRTFFRSITRNHDILVILNPSIHDAYAIDKRAIITTTKYMMMFAIVVMIFLDSSDQCCHEMRKELGCAGKTSEVQLYAPSVKMTKTPILSNILTTVHESVTSEAECFWIFENFKPQNFKCPGFSPNSWADKIVVALIASLCCVPIKVLLKYLFTVYRTSEEGLWVRTTTAPWRRPDVDGGSSNEGFAVRQKKEEKHLKTLAPIDDDALPDRSHSVSYRKAMGMLQTIGSSFSLKKVHGVERAHASLSDHSSTELATAMGNGAEEGKLPAPVPKARRNRRGSDAGAAPAAAPEETVSVSQSLMLTRKLSMVRSTSIEASQSLPPVGDNLRAAQSIPVGKLLGRSMSAERGTSGASDSQGARHPAPVDQRRASMGGPHSTPAYSASSMRRMDGHRRRQV